MGKVLMHICCGPCAVHPLEALRAEGLDVHGFFYNPNIHPWQEFDRRRRALEQLAASADLPVIYDDRYDLETFLRETVFRETHRCRFCYLLRLEAAARIARRGKFKALTTTLLYSKFQKHDLIHEIGREVAHNHGLEFLYRDFRQGWREGIVKSKELGLYRQQYCGCIYSEKERFAPPDQGK